MDSMSSGIEDASSNKSMCISKDFIIELLQGNPFEGIVVPEGVVTDTEELTETFFEHWGLH